MPWYSWNTARVGIKHQSINQSINHLLFTECKYTEWSEWTECSKECDVGCRTRDRIKLTITNPNICAEDIKEIEDCNIGPCITTSKFKIFTTFFYIKLVPILAILFRPFGFIAPKTVN